MSGGWNNAIGNPTYGSLPRHLNTWSRDELGCVAAARKLTRASSGTCANLTLDHASLATSANAQMIVVRLPGQPASRYCTVDRPSSRRAVSAWASGDFREALGSKPCLPRLPFAPRLLPE